MTLSLSPTSSPLPTLTNFRPALGSAPESIATAGPTTTRPIASATAGLIASSSVSDTALEAIDRATSLADTASAAGATVSEALVQIRRAVGAATYPSVNDAQRSALSAGYASLVAQIGTAVANAGFGGVNLLDGSSEPSGLTVPTSPDGSSSVTLHGADLSPGGAVISLPAAADLSSPETARSLLAQVDNSITATKGVLENVDVHAASLAVHGDALASLSAGNTVGDTTDADTAGLLALQVRQQLGSQTSSLANSAPQSVLNLFKR